MTANDSGALSQLDWAEIGAHVVGVLVIVAWAVFAPFGLKWMAVFLFVLIPTAVTVFFSIVVTRKRERAAQAVKQHQ